ncbi:MAG: hypothetical protein AB7V77_02915 [Candidatus Woesearchaeota archaeon]
MGEYELQNYPSLNGLKESDFQENVKTENTKNQEIKTFFSKIKKINNLSELSNFIMTGENKLPKEFNSKNYEKLERYVQQILVNEGLYGFEKIKNGEINFEEELDNKPAFAYILSEGVLDENEVSEITYKHKFYRYTKRSFVDKNLIPNLSDRICEFLEEPGSFTLNDEGIPKEFYEQDYF